MESSSSTERDSIFSQERKNCPTSQDNYQHWQDDVALVALLKACATQKNLCRGIRMHAHIVKWALLHSNVFIGNTLVHMYSNCGALAKAHQVFDQLPVRTIVSWNTLVAGYVHHGNNEEALKCLQHMQGEGLSPDRFTFACILSACGSVKAAERGKLLHAEIVMHSLLEDDTVLGNALVAMYAKCGALDDAQNVFDKLPLRNEVSWTALLTGFCHHGYEEETLSCFALMKQEGLVPDIVTFACLLKACACIESSEKGEVIHASILREGFLGRYNIVGIALVDMYAKCDALPRAHFLLKEHCVQETVSWNALIAGYCQHGHGQNALTCFENMENGGLYPDAVTYACVLKACASIGAAEKGQEVHAEIVRKGFLRTDAVLGNALVNMYAKCGALANAQEVFDKLFVRDVATWTALLAGYCEKGNDDNALEYFERMRQEGVFPDGVTLSCILKACGNIRAVEKGRQLHAEIIRRGLLGNVRVLESALMDMYINCGAVSKAHLVFDEISCPNVVSWNVLISGYYDHGRSKDAIHCFELMRCSPDVVTYASILKACGSIGAAQKGDEIHSEIVRGGLLAKYISLGTALVDMYAKCGALRKSQEVFDELPVHDVVSFTALITAYTEQGDGDMAFTCFEQMINEGLSPDAITFSCILKACSNIGEAEKGQMYFESMSNLHEIIPSVEHHTCMVDVLSRSGHYDRAMTLIEKMPPSHHCHSWFTLLNACQTSGNVKLGRLAFEHV